MTLAEAVETTRIHRVAGLTGDRMAWVTTRPCRAPHHPISDVGLIGGGHVPMPGDVSLAHHGMLVLDELPEFKRHVLEVIRQPLARVSYEYTLQSLVGRDVRAMLVAQGQTSELAATGNPGLMTPVTGNLG
jgi:hypothetical protein